MPLAWLAEWLCMGAGILAYVLHKNDLIWFAAWEVAGKMSGR
jgi:hypothetical protein